MPYFERCEFSSDGTSFEQFSSAHPQDLGPLFSFSRKIRFCLVKNVKNYSDRTLKEADFSPSGI